MEAAATLRRLMVQPWLVASRDDDAIAAVRRNLRQIRDTLRRLGWVLVVERDLVRLRKSAPVRRQAWARGTMTALQASWFFLLAAGAESIAPRVGLAQLVTSARSAAAEAGLSVTGDIAERRAIVRALAMLDARGVIERLEGDLDAFVEDDDPPVLLAVHHARLAHLIANYAPGDPTADPAGWLTEVEREPDPSRRMRRRLVDDAVVHAVDLDEAETDWLRRRARGDDGGPLAEAFGLRVERRAEGAAFVVPDDAFRHAHELGPFPFPGVGTIQHAALILCELAARIGVTAGAGSGPGPGWRGLSRAIVVGHLTSTAAKLAAGRGGWRRELADDPDRLAGEVGGLLGALDLVRLSAEGDAETWWFSPATGRWTVAAAGAEGTRGG